MARYVKTGHFDPWQIVYDEAEETVAAQRRDARQTGGPPLRLTETSTEEEIAEYRRRSAERYAEVVAEVQRTVTETSSEFDEWCAEKMLELYEEAFWMGETHEFRDGKPLSEQNEWRVGLLAMIRAGITQRQWGGGESKGDDADGEPPSREMSAEELESWLGKQQ